jgi:hypothetical protein
MTARLIPGTEPVSDFFFFRYERTLKLPSKDKPIQQFLSCFDFQMNGVLEPTHDISDMSLLPSEHGLAH